MKLALASSLALVGAASAATSGPYNLGVSNSGFETGVLNATLLCNVTSTGLNLKNQQILFGVAAILPNRVDATQSFNVIAGTRLIVPASINNLAYGFGARYYAGNATKVIVNAQGSTPAFIDAATKPLPIPSAPVVSGGVSVLEVPGKGGVITVGPFKAASANSNIVFSFGDIAAVVKTYNATGGATFLVANIACPAQARPASLAFVASGGAGSTNIVTPSGGEAITTIPINSTAGSTGYTYSCTFDGIGTSPITLSVAGAKTNNAAVASGSNVALSLGQGQIFVEKALTDLFIAKYPTANGYKLNVTTLNFLASGASPASKNGAPSTGYATPITPVSSTTTALTIPDGAPTNTLPDISFTAGASGGTALLSLGSAGGIVTIYSGNAVVGTSAFSCPALSPATPIFPFDIQ
ncbi:hypothetical protein CF328_g4834 [Tilletia controversa]|nr:hypothetical protein CF328_g4834 [Tilletia controversa]